MANTSSAKKAVRTAARRTNINQARRSRVKTFIRSVEEAVTRGDKKAAEAALKLAQPVIVRAGNRQVMHKNTASRKISRLAHRVKSLKD